MFSARGGIDNKGVIVKSSTDAGLYTIEFGNELPSGVTISSAANVAIDRDSQTVTSNVVNANGTVSGSTVRVSLLTGGSGGSGAGTNLDRFRVRTTATLSSGGPLVFDTFILIQAPAYDPASDPTTVNTHIYAETPSGSLNGTNTSFTLAQTPTSGSLQLFYFAGGSGAGVLWLSGTNYTLSGTTITATVAPMDGDALRAYYTYAAAAS